MIAIPVQQQEAAHPKFEFEANLVYEEISWQDAFAQLFKVAVFRPEKSCMAEIALANSLCVSYVLNLFEV